MKIMSFCQQGPEAICILSVNGVMSKAVISRPQSSRTLFMYEVKHFCNNLIVVVVSIFPNSMY